MRRKRTAVFVVMCTLFALILTACGGGGGTGGEGNSGIGNTMTVSVDGAAPTTYTEGAINGNGYYDPDMEADLYLDGSAIVELSSGVTGGSTPPVTLINIVTNDFTRSERTLLPGLELIAGPPLRIFIIKITQRIMAVSFQAAR